MKKYELQIKEYEGHEGIYELVYYKGGVKRFLYANLTLEQARRLFNEKGGVCLA